MSRHPQIVPAELLTTAVGIVLILLATAPAIAEAERPGNGGRLGPVVEEVVLSVGEKFLTRSDLELEARVALVARGGFDAAYASIGEEVMASVRELMINELVVLAEVERLGVFDVSEEKAASEVKRFEALFADEDAYRAFLDSQDVGPERLAAMFRRKLRVRRYLESRVTAPSMLGSDHGGCSEKEGRRDLSGVGGEGRLDPAEMESSVSRLIESLRRRADIRYLAGLRGAPAVRMDERTAAPGDGG